MTKYQGHKNYNHWNVNLYLQNDYHLYKMISRLVAGTRTKDEVAQYLLDFLPSHTPDGVKYSFSSIRAALMGWEKA